MKYRKVEILKEDKWLSARLENVKKGDKFRMWEVNGLFLGEWISETDAFLSNNGPNGEEAWTVEVNINE